MRDTCAISADHRVWCWGTNAEGQIGDGTMTGEDCPDFQPCHPSPTLVGSLVQATAIAERSNHVCAIVGNGDVWCWGSNGFAEAGDGTTTGQPCLNANAAGCKPTPVSVVSIHDAVSIAAGFGHNCVIRSGGVVSCWGEDGAGEIGDAMKTSVACNGNVPCVPTPFDVTSLGTGVKAIAAGTFDTCAIKSDDTLWCWGSNEFGNLGDGTTTGSLVPVEVPIGSVSAVAMGFDHACAIKTDGTLWCWGRNDGGQLGDGTTNGSACSFTVCRPSPVQVAALGTNAA